MRPPAAESLFSPPEQAPGLFRLGRLILRIRRRRVDLNRSGTLASCWAIGLDLGQFGSGLFGSLFPVDQRGQTLQVGRIGLGGRSGIGTVDLNRRFLLDFVHRFAQTRRQHETAVDGYFLGRRLAWGGRTGRRPRLRLSPLHGGRFAGGSVFTGGSVFAGGSVYGGGSVFGGGRLRHLAGSWLDLGAFLRGRLGPSGR